jgi:membrane-bound lytic murein transglycosylase D
MRTFFLLLSFFTISYSYAQVTLWQELREKMIKEGRLKTVEDSIVSNPVDTGLVVPATEDITDNDLLDSSANETNNNARYQASDSVYMARLSKLPNIVELPYNETVRRCIDLYVERRRESVENMLGTGDFYFPMIEETLDKYGLPMELKYLAVVESALNPVALSRAGASGLWQFILSTGKRYGLEINSLLDERRDPVKATDAACRYLKNLYDMFNDWNLAIAAYNCGEGNVYKAIARAGGKTDYWAIYPYLPKETRTYLPLFIAANYVMNYYADHQLFPNQTIIPLSTDTVMVNQQIHFDQIANVLNIDKETIRILNPQYKKDIIPGNYQPQALKLPANQVVAFVEKENEIANYRTDELFTNRTYVKESKAVDRLEKIVHKVSRGETIVTIANRYGVSAKSIRKWNGLRSNRVLAGKKLILYVDNGRYSALRG